MNLPVEQEFFTNKNEKNKENIQNKINKEKQDKFFSMLDKLVESNNLAAVSV